VAQPGYDDETAQIVDGNKHVEQERDKRYHSLSECGKHVLEASIQLEKEIQQSDR